MGNTLESSIVLDTQTILDLCGKNDEYLKLIEDACEATIIVRGNELKILGSEDAVKAAKDIINELLAIYKAQNSLTRQLINYTIHSVKSNTNSELQSALTEKIQIPRISEKLVKVSPKTINQKRYIDAINDYDIVFAIGPAGTGKTFLAMSMAVVFLLNQSVNRIVLVRPAVEAGEKLGFLPGDIAAKVNPYLRPLYDALYYLLGPEKALKYIESGFIEIAPLAFMRGRTLDEAFVILDEGQNTTNDQMKMFLTRLGINSKAVITGDITQIDLPDSKASGLVNVQSILKGIEGIAFIYFDDKDVVRHELVQNIIKAYERYEKQ